ncbi:MAG: acyl-ACP--UDP-N-acetylglucosamine O-acyltransferase [Acidobacteria bacterium]|nr:MAG: acyl-ACP--UDP-N-acetylglucosamine O-acyltransferase [Acidobacteriota bacterium]
MDPRAVVHEAATVHPTASIGPFAVVGPEVEIGPRCRIGPHVVLDGKVTIGADNVFYPFTTVGFPPQDLKYAGEATSVVIGDRNVFRENCQVHRGTRGGGGVTRIGNDGYFMVASHIAHDCTIGDHVLFANAATLAGHVEVGDHATIGAYSGVHQFCRVGPYAYIGGYSVVTRDALPFCLTVGNRAHCYGVNRIGLRRQGFAPETIARIERAVLGLFRRDRSRAESMAAVEAELGEVPEVRLLLDFVRGSRRGVVPIRPAAAD